MGAIKTFNEFVNESIWSDMRDRITGGVSYSTLKHKGCKVNLLYKYLIDNYDVLGDEQIKLTNFGDTYYGSGPGIEEKSKKITTYNYIEKSENYFSLFFNH